MEDESPISVYPLEEGTPAAANNAFGRPPYGPPPGPADTTAFGTHRASGASVAPPARADGPPRQKQGLKTWLAGGLAALVFGLAGFFGIQAVTHHTQASTTATGPGSAGFPGGGPGGAGGPGGGAGGGRRALPGGGGTVGTITSLSGSTLMLSTRGGSTATVTTSPSTTVTKAVAGSVSDIKAGDHVVVRGSGSGAVAATSITDTGSTAGSTAAGPGVPPGAGNPVSGIVASVGTATFTVTETGDTTATVTTSSSTGVTLVQPSSVSALAVGDTVRVTGTVSGTSVAATSIQSGATGFGPDGPGGPGGPGFGGRGGGFGGPPAA